MGGGNIKGQLGNGNNTNSNIPIQVSSLTGITAVAVGDNHSLALKSDGSVWSWGWNAYGQLGNGTNNDSNVPVQVSSLTGILSMAAGWYHSLAINSDSTVSAWGENYSGQLGNGTNMPYSNTPVQVSTLSGVTAIAGGWKHSLALKSDGTLWAWGDNTYGQLGNGTYLDSNLPTQVTGLTGIIAIAGGPPWHYLALKNDGTVWSWGYNSYGQLGDGTTINRDIPVQVSSFSDIVAIAAGYEYSLALKNDGSVLAWGWNNFGQLGNGTNLSSNVPVPVNSLTGITLITAGGGTSIAQKNDGTIWTWGNNTYGELGNGSNANSNTPLQISGTCQVLTTSNETQNQPVISVFPNPTTGMCTINLQNTTVVSQICVYDLLGNCLWNKNCQNETNPKIDLSSQPKGIYFMGIVSNGNRSINKIVLQ